MGHNAKVNTTDCNKLTQKQYSSHSFIRPRLLQRKSAFLVKRDMDINGHERLSNITQIIREKTEHL